MAHARRQQIARQSADAAGDGHGADDDPAHIDARIAVSYTHLFDLSPDGIIRMLDLRRPIYRQTAAYGHFGRPDLDLPWEALD